MSNLRQFLESPDNFELDNPGPVSRVVNRYCDGKVKLRLKKKRTSNLVEVRNANDI